VVTSPAVRYVTDYKMLIDNLRRYKVRPMHIINADITI
jgi:hypothetical protein